jgi:hypothetical protein
MYDYPRKVKLWKVDLLLGDSSGGWGTGAFPTQCDSSDSSDGWGTGALGDSSEGPTWRRYRAVSADTLERI